MVAIIYARLSAKNQRGEASLGTQIDVCNSYAKHNKFQVGKIFSHVCTGRFGKNKKMLDKCLKFMGKGDIFIVYDISRISRHLLTAMVFLNKIELKGCKIYSVLDGVGYDTPSQKEFVRSRISKSELESDMISEKVRNSFQRIRSLGGLIGAPRFGFRAERVDGIRREVLDNVETALAKAIVKKSYGFTIPELVRELNSRNITNRKRRWTSPAIKKLFATHCNSMDSLCARMGGMNVTQRAHRRC